jgi:hypothetical protein
VVDASPLVMAIWSLEIIWDIPDRLTRSTRQNRKRRIAGLVQEERPTHVRTYTRG